MGGYYYTSPRQKKNVFDANVCMPMPITNSKIKTMIGSLFFKFLLENIQSIHKCIIRIWATLNFRTQ